MNEYNKNYLCNKNEKVLRYKIMIDNALLNLNSPYISGTTSLRCHGKNLIKTTFLHLFWYLLHENPKFILL